MERSKSEIASLTAKGGIDNEKEVAAKFTNWRNDTDAQQWLKLMMYDLDEIESVEGVYFGKSGYKSDVLVTVVVRIRRKKQEEEIVSIEKIQVKLVSGQNGSNQVERKYVDSYIKQWHMPEGVVNSLKLFCGALPPREGSRNEKRMYIDELLETEQNELKDFLEANAVMIISDIMRGRGRFAAEWMLVIHKYQGYKWKLVCINEAINHYVGDHKAEITNEGGLRLGNITIQRKGGDGGKITATMLQFKANPLSVFSIPD